MPDGGDGLAVHAPLETATGFGPNFDTAASAWRRAGLVLVAAAAVVYLASISSHWQSLPDSALYLMLADNLVEGHGYTLWGEPHRHVPPGYPAFLAAQKSIGLNTFLAWNCVAILVGMAAIACCYLGLRTQLPQAITLWIVALLAWSHVMHLNSVRILSDVPFMCLVWLGLWLQMRGMQANGRHLELGSLVLLASCAVRVVGIPIVFGSALGLVLQSGHASRKRVWANAAGMVVVLAAVGGGAAAYLLYSQSSSNAPSYFTHLARKFQGDWWALLWQPFDHALRTGPELSILFTRQTHSALGQATAILWIPVLVGLVVGARRRQMFFACVFVAYLGPLLVVRPLLARYLLPVAPLFFLYFIDGVRWFAERGVAWSPRGRRVAIVCGVVLLAFNVPKAVKVAYEQHFPKPPEVGSERFAIAQVAEFLRTTAGPTDRFITNQNDRLISYLSGVWSIPGVARKLAYSGINPEELETWHAQGARFVVLYSARSRKYNQHFRQVLDASDVFHKVRSSDAWEIYSARSPEEISAATKTNSSAVVEKPIQSRP